MLIRYGIVVETEPEEVCDVSHIRAHLPESYDDGMEVVEITFDATYDDADTHYCIIDLERELTNDEVKLCDAERIA